MKTLAGGGANTSVDGTGTAATFANPLGIGYAATAQGMPTLFVTDNGTGFLRTLTLGTNVVATVESRGTTLAAGSTYGIGVQEGTLNYVYVASAGADYRISLPTTPNPTTTPFAINKALGSPATIALNGANSNVFTTNAASGDFWMIANTNSLYVRTSLGTNLPATGNYGLVVTGTTSPTAYVTDMGMNLLFTTPAVAMMTSPTTLHMGAPLNMPAGVTMLGGMLYVANCGGNDIIRVTTTGTMATVVAGSGAAAEADGYGTAAAFNCPFGITNDGTNLYVTDGNGNTVRMISGVM